MSKRTRSGVKNSKKSSENEESIPTKLQKLSSENLAQSFIESRNNCSQSGVSDFLFNKKRVRILSEETSVKAGCDGILYWMDRDQRVQDNWAFLFAQKLALKNRVPLHVCYCLLSKSTDTWRHMKFLLGGLEKVHKECKSLQINFRLLRGYPVESINEYIEDENIGGVVCDFSPLRTPKEDVEILKNVLPKDITLVQVDAHNIVPVWEASEKQEYSARTIRNKINSRLKEFLEEFPPVIKHPHEYKRKSQLIDFQNVLSSLECNRDVIEADWAKPGLKNACDVLYSFCENRLEHFADCRNIPTGNFVSNLSPWFHFGQLSCQRAILYIKTFKSKFPHAVDVYCEEAIVRRELADNFCFYNENYDNLSGLSNWAHKTLNDHRNDERNPCYSTSVLEAAKTHDDLWNSAQIQLLTDGKMHGFLRMYWAKKILEWTKSPEEALETAIFLNDKYSLDGRDPNGYVGCMWSIGGVHDQGWGERPIFGKIRFMNYKGCKKWFDIPEFVSQFEDKMRG
ncbi:phr.2 family protein [Megaselia abdita]